MSTTLLLNASYEPLAVVPLRRAVVLVLRERAEIVAEHPDRQVTTGAGAQLPWPAVIRLKRYIRIPYRRTRPPSISKAGVLARDHHRCAYCDAGASTVDHVVPRARGGRTVWSNCVAACKRCNAKKGSRTLDELGWTLRVTPCAPEPDRIVIAIVATDEAWEPYLAYAV